MVRMIDGNALEQWCEKIIDQACHLVTAQIGEAFLSKVRSMPTLTSPNEWVSVEEKLPPPKQNVLAYSTRSGIAEADYADGVWMQYRWSAVMESVTHWMPLPEPPEKESEGR